jgi:hypothetical protein
VKFIAEFDRISRDHKVPPLTVDVDEGNPAKGRHPSPEQMADQIAEQVYRYAYPRTISRGIEVVVDLDTMAGTIFAGLHVAGSFTLRAVDA